MVSRNTQWKYAFLTLVFQITGVVATWLMMDYFAKDSTQVVGLGPFTTQTFYLYALFMFIGFTASGYTMALTFKARILDEEPEEEEAEEIPRKKR